MEIKFKYKQLSRGIKEDVLLKLKPFLDLLQLDQEMAKKRVTVHSIPGIGNDIDREEIRPGHVIPNIRKFGITLMPYDGLLLIFNMFKKYESTKEFGAGRNSSANHYVDYMFKRLRKQVERREYHKASKTIWILMNSEAYQVSALNHVLRNWHRHLKGINVKRTLLKVRKLCKEQATDIQYHRVYIPKDPNDPSKGFRPLGVPSPEGRIYLHMYNNILVQGRLVSEGENQHAYLPKRGVITAGKRLAELLTEMPNIYEADFQNFFDSIDLDGLRDILGNIGLPALEAAHIDRLNESLVKLSEVDLKFEPTRKIYLDKDGRPNPQMDPKYDTENLIEHEVLGRGAPIGKGKTGEKREDGNGYPVNPPNPELFKVMYATLMAPKESSYQASYAKGWDELKHLPEFRKAMNKRTGVPQGAPTSCSLATLAFRPLEAQMDKPFPVDKAEGTLVDRKDLEANQYTELTELKQRHLKATKKLEEYKAQFNLLEKLGTEEYLFKFSYLPSRVYLEQIENRVNYLEELIKIITKHRGKGKILFYADDVIYFPHNPNEDPVSVLENNKLGIKVNLSKSDGVKREGIWLKDSIKFLGMRYYPSRKITFNDVKLEDIMIIFGLCYSLDVILFSGGPIFLALGLLSQGPVLYYRTQERFIAETRKGATLEFSSKESFISGLDIMRDGILSGSIDPNERERIIKGGVKAGLEEEYGDWKRGATTRRVKWLGRTKLVGYFFSRMQADSWHISIEQDFRLKPVAGSGIGECWPTYANKGGLENRELNVFNASSFACNDLMDGLRRLKQLKRNKKSKVRYVFTKASPRKRRTAASNSTERAMKGLFKSRSSRNPAAGV